MKKSIICFIISQLFLFCTSEGEQKKIYEIRWLIHTEDLLNDKGNCDDYQFTKSTVFGTYIYSGRGLDGNLEYTKGWDWMNKILYQFADEKNIRFNNQHWINQMDKLLFDQELILIQCQKMRNIMGNSNNYSSSLSQFKSRLHRLQMFMVENSQYFDSEVLIYVNQKIEKLMPK